MVEKEKSYKPSDYLHDFQALSSAQPVAKVTLNSDAQIMDDLAYLKASEITQAYSEITETLTSIYGPEKTETVAGYYTKEKSRKEAAIAMNVDLTHISRSFCTMIKRAYTTRKRKPRCVADLIDDQESESRADLLIEKASHYWDYKSEKKKLKAKINQIYASTGPKSPSLENTGASNIHDPFKSEKAVLNMICKKDRYVIQLEYCQDMIQWIEEAVSGMEPTWALKFIECCHDDSALSEIASITSCTRSRVQKDFRRNAKTVMTDDAVAKYNVIQARYQAGIARLS